MPEAKQPTVRIPPALIGVGVLVIALGFGLPLLTSQQTPAPLSATPSTPQVAKEFTPRANEPAPANLVVSLLRFVAALTVVCGLCVLAAKWLGRKPPAPGEAAMQVVASLRVGRCSVHLVRAGERRMLIGTDANGVKSLVELPGPAPEPVPEAPTASPVSSPG